MEVVDFRPFPDHHPYGAADVAGLADRFRAAGVELALTTQKDLVKLRALGLGPVPLRALRIGLELIHGAEVLDRALSTLLPSGKGCPVTPPDVELVRESPGEPLDLDALRYEPLADRRARSGWPTWGVRPDRASRSETGSTACRTSSPVEG